MLEEEISKILDNSNYKNHLYSFYPIEPRGTGKSFVFIDGGNAEIISSADFSVHIVRVAAVSFSKNTRVNTVVREGTCIITDRCRFVEGNFPDMALKEIDKVRERCENIVGSELQLDDNSVIMFDGNIRDIENGIVTGLVKTSRLLHDRKNLISILHKQAPYKRWFVKIDKNDYMVKLHPSSEHIFRLQLPELENLDVKKLLGVLASNARDPVFPGYPYGLVVADQKARVSDAEKEYMKSKLMHKLGKELRLSMASLNSHEWLDSIS